MSMSSPVEATLALDGLAIGAQVVACGIDDDGTAFGLLYEHRQLSNGTRYWKQVTGNGVALLARAVIDTYDDMVVTHLPTEGTPDTEQGE